MRIDPQLLRKARRLGSFRTNAQAINVALAEYVRRREQLKIFELAGTVDYDPRYNYKRQRRIR
ncbi:MAG TPA: type II toxin-antitoxin system VapB family antitoxin [Tepidisphaeraceae bacterium]|jgi:hypothetical protein|nr:type II toxin-antitoxin system VapB family antitoxin [Tepidisphaeraceae bacterium]